MTTTRGDSKIDRLAGLSLFGDLSRRELEKVAEITSEITVKAGTVLMRQDAPSHDAVVIVDGEAEISVDGTVVAVVGAGEAVGEMGLLDGEPRSATVTARTDLDIYVIEPRRFRTVLEEVPSIARTLLVTVTKRLRAADRRMG